jgi:hypothetical protein
MMRVVRQFCLAVGLWLSWAGCLQAGAIYDLAADWSDTNNPNGVWTYLAAPGVPLTSHLDNWGTSIFTAPQPAWAYAPYPAVPGHVPAFYKVVATTVDSDPNHYDQPIGSVVIHNNDRSSGPDLQSLPMGITWTAPTDGTIQISGGLWEVQRNLGRTELWSLTLNDNLLTNGQLTPSSGTSATPLNLTAGSAGAAVLTQTVQAGDVLFLQFARPNPADENEAGTTIGVDFTIELTTTVPEPSSCAMLITGGLCGLAAARRARQKRRAD